MLRNWPGEKVLMEVDDVEIRAHCELRRNLPFEAVSGEVEHGEVDQRLEVRRDGSGEEVGGEVKSLEVGTVGEERGNRAVKREVVEGEFVDSAIVADCSLKIRS